MPMKPRNLSTQDAEADAEPVAYALVHDRGQ